MPLETERTYLVGVHVDVKAELISFYHVNLRAGGTLLPLQTKFKQHLAAVQENVVSFDHHS